MDLESLDHAKSPRRRYGQLSTTMAAANRYGQLQIFRAPRTAQSFRHGEFTIFSLLAAPKLLKLHTAAAINSNDETEQKDHHLTTSYSYSQAQAS
jgi:hypothetical protein